MARLVVTGGLGFIGSCFVRRRLATGKDEVVVVDKLTYAGNPNNLKDYKDDRNLTFVQGDVCDRKLMDRITKSAEALVHFAAETHVDRSILEAGDFVRTDVIGTWSVLEACRKNDVKGFAISRPTKYTEKLPAVRRRSRTRSCRKVPTPPRRPERTDWPSPTSRRTVCRSSSRAAPTTTDRTNTRRS